MEDRRPGWYPDKHGNMLWWNGVSWSEPKTPHPTTPSPAGPSPANLPPSSPPVQKISWKRTTGTKEATGLPSYIRRIIIWFTIVFAFITIAPIVIGLILFIRSSNSSSEPAETLSTLVAYQDCDTLKNNMSENMLYLTISASDCKSFSPDQASKFVAFVEFYDPSRSDVSTEYFQASGAATIKVTPQDIPEAAVTFHFSKERSGISRNWVLGRIVYDDFDKPWYAGDPGQAPPSVADCIASADYSRLVATDELTRAAAEGGVLAYCKYDIEYDSDFAGGLQPITVAFNDPEPGQTEPTSAKVAIIIGESQKTITSWTYLYDGEWG